MFRKYYSQLGQDKIVMQILKKKKIKKGIYFDIGANDGITISNTFVFEKKGWKGICVEPDSDVFEKLVRNRKCHCKNVAISSENGSAKFTKIVGYSQMLSGLTDSYSERHKKRIQSETEKFGNTVQEIEVETRTIDTIMQECFKDVYCIDYMSIDSEGSEEMILRSIDFDRYVIHVLSVENNYDDDNIREYMKTKGYKVIKHFSDDIYYL